MYNSKLFILMMISRKNNIIRVFFIEMFFKGKELS